jgi:nucleoside-diphosphate-sugar epimerase
MRTLLTGAAGFIGQATRAALAMGGGEVVATDRWGGAGSGLIAADLTEAGIAPGLVHGADRVIHLAALPGGAAEANPALSAAVNLHATLRLAEAAAATGTIRFVYASSVAVFGAPLPDRVDDDTAVCPSMTYGTHKAAVELLLADLARRGSLEAISLRLPGVVGRPRAPSGLKSAFMSDVFHAIRAGEPITLPVSPDATLWLMSPRAAAAALIHAATLPARQLPSRPITLPALRVATSGLVDAIAAVCGATPAVAYDPDPIVEAQFGRLPPLSTGMADALGFHHDGSLEALVTNVLADLAP